MGHSPALQGTLRNGAGTTRACAKCGQPVADILDRCPHDGAPVLSAAAMARVGTCVGDYEIKGVIGEGGTGVVYRGRHVASDRSVAIKILHDRGARQKDVVEQFLGEARTTSRIRHPNVIYVTDLGTTPDGTVFLAMESLEGESLWSRLRQVQHLPLFEAINILRQVARGLGAAHAAGMVHGGLKPADIFLCTRVGRRRIVRRSKAHGMRLVVEAEGNFDLVKLLDFGLARFLDLAPGAQARAGAVSGTLHYLSPEQAQGESADQRSDIYSLGAVFYEMITGTVPFGGESLLDILRGHVSGQVIAPSRRTPGAGIHMRIDALILRCLKKNPALRFADTSELCGALDECITDCAFLRDAHRLSGISESGIDLSEASPQARQDRERSSEKPAVTPVAEKPVIASVAAKPAVASVVQKTAVAPLAQKPAGATVVAKPVAASAAQTFAAAAAATKPEVATVPQKKAATLAKPTIASVAQKFAVTPIAATPALASLPLKPAAASMARKSTIVALAAKPVPALAAQASAKLRMEDDPDAAVITPPPTAVKMVEEPPKAVDTPPPAAVVADLSAEVSAAIDDPPSQGPLERSEEIVPDIEERPEHFDLDAAGIPGKLGRLRRLITLAGVLLLGGVALWATRSGSAHSPTKPVLVSRTASTPTAAPPPTSLTAAPGVAPAASADPVAPPVAPVPTPAPSLVMAVPAAAPVAPAVVPAPELPTPEPAAPAEMAEATARAADKLALSRIRPTQASSARRTARVGPVPPESAPVLAAKTTPAPAVEPVPRSEPLDSNTATAKSAPTPPAPVSVDDLVRQAQHAWMAGHYAQAISKAQTALKAQPMYAQIVQAYEIIATSSCALGLSAAAREATFHLSGAERELVKTMCKASGMTIE
ncbi:MAG TPA: protein kinase [Polyangia bacterium]